MTDFNEETGEVIEPPQRGPMPAEIAKAIVSVMKQTKQLGFDERNEHGKYNYASIDKFLSAFRPLCAEAGLIIMLDEISCEFRVSTGERQTNYAFPTYAVWLIHESGATWGPLTRRLSLPATGPQAFGAAESYVLKRFMRNLFQVATGEKDADELAEGEIPAGRSTRGNGARRPARQEPAPPPSDERQEALRCRDAVIKLIDEAPTPPHLDGIEASLAWGRFVAAMDAASVGEAARDTALGQLRQKIDARRTDLLTSL